MVNKVYNRMLIATQYSFVTITKWNIIKLNKTIAKVYKKIIPVSGNYKNNNLTCLLIQCAKLIRMETYVTIILRIECPF